jgi:hypothetical protein
MIARMPRSVASAMRSSIASRSCPLREEGRIGVVSSIVAGIGEP